MTLRIHELSIPHLDLDLAGVDVDTARQVIALLPAALERALYQNRPTVAGALPGSAQALADTAAARVAAQVAARIATPREGSA